MINLSCCCRSDGFAEIVRRIKAVPAPALKRKAISIRFNDLRLLHRDAQLDTIHSKVSARPLHGFAVDKLRWHKLMQSLMLLCL